MLADYVLIISDVPKANGPFELILKLDHLYAHVWKAMGIWSVKNYSRYIASGYSSEDSHHTRWFWDIHNKEIKLKIGWFDGNTDEDAITAFEFFVAKGVLKVGDWGRGNYYEYDYRKVKKFQVNISWKVVRIEAASRRDYPVLKN